MTRLRACGLWFAAATAGGLLTVPGAIAGRATIQDPPQAAFRSGASAVMVDVTVRDGSRRAITGLTAKDFQVFDNGVPQQVDEVSYGKLPIDVTVALDVSYSVTGDLLDRLRQAVAQLMRDLGSKDRLKLVLFSTRITRTLDYTTDVKAVERAIRGTSAGGSTALLDAISVTLVSASPADRRQLIVFFTDGSDTSSTTSPAILTEVAGRTRATLAFVVPFTAGRPVVLSSLPALQGASVPPALQGSITPPPGVTPVAAPSAATLSLNPVLSTLARETGGTMLPVSAAGNLSDAFRRVLNEFRSAYVLYYTARGVERAGYHALDVKVTRDGALVEARRGYFSS
jgi:VWFA-related protein